MICGCNHFRFFHRLDIVRRTLQGRPLNEHYQVMQGERSCSHELQQTATVARVLISASHAQPLQVNPGRLEVQSERAYSTQARSTGRALHDKRLSSHEEASLSDLRCFFNRHGLLWRSRRVQKRSSLCRCLSKLCQNPGKSSSYRYRETATLCNLNWRYILWLRWIDWSNNSF